MQSLLLDCLKTESSDRHVVSSRTVLVWGASPQSTSPLYRHPERPKGAGGNAAELRQLIRDHLNKHLADQNCFATYSEDCDTYRHHPSNAGLYEPYHLTAAGAVVLVLPGSTSMGVNTWEVTLICEENLRTGMPEYLDKAIFVCPKSLWDFLRSFFASGLDDPMKHVGSPLTELGPANSFLARWISKAAYRTFVRAARPVPKAPPFRLAVYPDDIAWDPCSEEGERILNNLLGNLRHELESILSKSG